LPGISITPIGVSWPVSGSIEYWSIAENGARKGNSWSERT